MGCGALSAGVYLCGHLFLLQFPCTRLDFRHQTVKSTANTLSAACYSSSPQIRLHFCGISSTKTPKRPGLLTADMGVRRLIVSRRPTQFRSHWPHAIQDERERYSDSPSNESTSSDFVSAEAIANLPAFIFTPWVTSRCDIWCGP